MATSIMVSEKCRETCLALFCKRPRLFYGKQRLAKTIGSEQALILARAMLDCALEDALAWPGPLFLSPASPEDDEWAGNLLNRAYRVIAQPEGNLGYRLNAIDDRLRREGHNRIIFIGSDAPALQPDHFNQAREALARYDVVLSPAADGGVVLMGAAVPWPDLTQLPWSSDRLGTALAEYCHGHRFRVSHISPGYDIDIAADLGKLWRDLAHDTRPARRILYHMLGEFLKRNEVRYG